MPNRSEPIARATYTASSVRSVSAPGWSTRELTGSRMKSTSESRCRSTASPYMSMITWWFRCRFMPGKPTPDARTIGGQRGQLHAGVGERLLQGVEVLVGREPHLDGVETGSGRGADPVTGVVPGF